MRSVIVSMFQYHTGPIKSFGDMLGKGEFYTNSFNTTLVQLKAPEGPSKKVERDGSFNTTLVQLKAKREWLALVRRQEFQYHTGPIKRERAPRDCEQVLRVSIPHWSN